MCLCVPLWIASKPTVLAFFPVSSEMREKQNDNKKSDGEKYESQRELAKSTTKLSTLITLTRSSLTFIPLPPTSPMLLSFHSYKDHKYLLLGFSVMWILSNEAINFGFAFFAIYYSPLCSITINMTTFVARTHIRTWIHAIVYAMIMRLRSRVDFFFQQATVRIHCHLRRNLVPESLGCVCVYSIEATVLQSIPSYSGPFELRGEYGCVCNYSNSLCMWLAFASL